MKKSEPNPLGIAVKTIVTEQCVDLYLYSGPIAMFNADGLRDQVLRNHQRHEKALLFLTTYGGSADAAYLIIRTLQRYYKSIRIAIFGPCKSAGTLIAIGADEIVFGPRGELGPLDVQLDKPDELMTVTSGLDTLGAFDTTREHAYKAFREILIDMVVGSRGAFSTKTACEVATQIATGMIAPIASQIDPYRLAEVQRRMEIARCYGNTLRTANLKTGALNWLIDGYPSHGFMIDEVEAATLFDSIGEASDLESGLATMLEFCLRTPSAETLVLDFSELAHEEQEDANHDNGSDSIKSEADVAKLRIAGKENKNPPKAPATEKRRGGNKRPAKDSRSREGVPEGISG